MEKWLKMPNFKFIICQQLLTNSFSTGGNYRQGGGKERRTIKGEVAWKFLCCKKWLWSRYLDNSLR